MSRAAATLTNPPVSDALAANVVDFGIWLYVRETGTDNLRRIFPAENDDLAHAAHGIGVLADSARFPDVADVMDNLTVRGTDPSRAGQPPSDR